ncbi:competence protein CoiA [Cryobacterium sp. W22_MBD10_FK3]|uniref:competence protein CoiA n=1 Tax=Cryobacterium sp. W22_MBD10_FK3 TaxID=3240273 RepID=UPI003F8DC301
MSEATFDDDDEEGRVMPLTAILGGRRVIAPLLTDAEWAQLRAGHPRLPCDAQAVSKENKSGTRYFAHWPGSHCEVEHKPESPEHLKSKEIIVRAAIAAGWQAAQEVPSEDRSWVADVLVTDGLHTVALEVQWSHQTPEEYHRRQARYLAAGIDAYWFARHKTTLSNYQVKVPVFGLTHIEDGFTAEQGPDVQLAGPSSASLADMVTNLLNGYPRRWRPLGELHQGVIVQWIWNKCWKCESWSQIWRCPDTRAYRCDVCSKIGIRYLRRAGTSFLDPSDPNSFFPTTPTVEMSQAVTAMIREKLQKPARIGSRLTKQSGVTHYGYHCPACAAPFGNMHLMSEKKDSWREDQVLICSATHADVPIADGGHWCQVTLDP